jgi:tetratricopeptide (TPR) repeat protein
VLVAAIVLHDLVLRRAGERLRAEHAIVGVVLGAYLLARRWVAVAGLPAEDIAPIDNPIVDAGFVAGRLTAFGVLARLARLVVWPARLSVDYSYRAVPIVELPPHGADDWIAFVGLAGVVVAMWALVRARRRAPGVVFLGALALVALLPSANLLRVIGSIMAERFLYLSLAGVAGCAALAVDGWARGRGRRAVVSVILVVAVLAGAARTRARNVDWQDERRLWEETVAAVPESAKAHKAYGAVLFNLDDARAELPRAIAEGERAVAIAPDYQQALVDLGSYYITRGDRLAAAGDDAIPWFGRAGNVLEKARALDERSTARFNEKMLARGNAADTIPDVGDGVLYTNLALAYMRLARYEEALATYQRLRALSPLNAALYRDIAAIQVALGRQDDAAVSLIEAMAVGGGDQETRERVIDFYRTFPHDGPSLVIQAPDGEHVDRTSPITRRHQCRAWHELVAIFTRARLAAAAERARTEAAACSGG